MLNRLVETHQEVAQGPRALLYHLIDHCIHLRATRLPFVGEPRDVRGGQPGGIVPERLAEARGMILDTLGICGSASVGCAGVSGCPDRVAWPAEEGGKALMIH